MKNNRFLQAIDSVNASLIARPVERIFNSIGSNIFLEFGKLNEVEFTNGKRGFQRQWSIWLSHASWRITKEGRYFIGSGENLDFDLQQHLQKLLGKRFQSLSFLSQFLDVEFNFEDGYQIKTFFNWMEENQWTIFLPDDSNVSVDCPDAAALKNVQTIASQFQIAQFYEKLDIPIRERVVEKVAFSEKEMPIFHLDQNFSLSLDSCAWRLEKEGDYLAGCLDDDQEKIKNELSLLIGKRLKQVDVAGPMMDARFQFKDGFVLKTFSCCREEEQWNVYEGKKLVFSAQIPLLEE